MDPITLALLGGSAIKGLSGFFGSKSAERKAKAAALAAEAKYNAGLDTATTEANTSAGKASGMYSPYAGQGTKANTLYNNAVGVNGRPAQSAFFASFQNDPGFQATLNEGRAQVEQSALFNGRANSGATQKELFDFGQRQKFSQFQDRLNRLNDAGQNGYRAVGQQAGIETNRGLTIADLALKRGTFGANTQQNLGQIRADGVAQRAGIIGDTASDLVSTFGRKVGKSGSSGSSATSSATSSANIGGGF